MQPTPTSDQLSAAIHAGQVAAKFAEQQRARHRGKRRLSRRHELLDALERCKEAAALLRRYIGMVFAHDLASQDELAMKRTLKVLEGERRKLRKML